MHVLLRLNMDACAGDSGSGSISRGPQFRRCNWNYSNHSDSQRSNHHRKLFLLRICICAAVTNWYDTECSWSMSRHIRSLKSAKGNFQSNPPTMPVPIVRMYCFGHDWWCFPSSLRWTGSMSLVTLLYPDQTTGSSSISQQQ